MSLPIEEELQKKFNNINFTEDVLKLKDYAMNNDVPIIQDEGLAFLLMLIRVNKPLRILEIGTAIGYSAINMALNSNAIIDTIERNLKMEEEAIKNVKSFNLNDRINLIFKDALESFDDVKDNKYDLIFIDAAKAQYIKFFEIYSPLLNDNGIIVSDNMLFHGIKMEDAKSRALRGLIRKLNNYQEYLLNNDKYNSSIFNIGDGMAVSTKK